MHFGALSVPKQINKKHIFNPLKNHMEEVEVQSQPPPSKISGYAPVWFLW